jgi:uncharacterized protein (DUF2344 family)
MALPRKGQSQAQVLQEIVEPVLEQEVQTEPEFLQEIKEPAHEEELSEQTKKSGKKKKRFGIF